MDLETIRQNAPTLRDTLAEVEEKIAAIAPRYEGLIAKRDEIKSQLAMLDDPEQNNEPAVVDAESETFNEEEDQ